MSVLSGQIEEKNVRGLLHDRLSVFKPEAGDDINPVFLKVLLHGTIFNGDL